MRFWKIFDKLKMRHGFFQKLSTFFPCRCIESTMDARFLRAIEVVLSNEGGFSNDKEDKGEATNFGVSLKFLQENNIHILCNQEITIDDVKAITRLKACQLYEQYFWDAYNIYEIQNLIVATKVLDMSINIGPSTAIRLIQESLNKQIKNTLNCDGVLGWRTLTSINNSNVTLLLMNYRQLLALHYQIIVESNPTQAKFLDGWLKRAMQ